MINALAEALFVEHKAAKPYHLFKESIPNRGKGICKSLPEEKYSIYPISFERPHLMIEKEVIEMGRESRSEDSGESGRC